MKHFIPLICAVLVLLVSPALCSQIHDMMPSVKRKAEQQQKDFENALEYVEFIKHVYLHPTVPNMRRLDRSGLREKMAEMCVHQPYTYTMIVDYIGGWEKYNEFLRKVDDSKKSEEWKILDDFDIDENKLMEYVS